MKKEESIENETLGDKLYTAIMIFLAITSTVVMCLSIYQMAWIFGWFG